MQSVNLLSTASLFSSQESFVIPRYQRPYSWSKQQIEALLLDYEDTVVKDNQEHIMGMIVLCKRPDNTQVIDIIDGQQRITTILIILSWVRDRLFDLSEHPDASITSQSRETAFAYNLDDLVWDPNDEKPRFTTENESHFEAQMLEIVLCRLSEISNQALKKEVREEYRRKYDGEDDVRKSTSSIKKKILSDPRVFNQTRAKAKAIVKNYKLIDEKLGEKLANEKTIDSQIKFLVKLGRSFSDKLQFVPLVVPNYSQAFRLFETMNDRGLSVSALDLVKNEALQYGSQDERTNTHEAWREAFVDNLPNSKDPLRFLRYAHNARHTFATKNDLFSSYKKSVFDGYDSVVKELEELKQFSSYYNLFLENEWGHDVYFREELVRLKTTKTLQWTTIGMVLLSLDKADQPERRQILKRILRLTHSLVFTQLIKDLRANLFEQYFPTQAVSLWKNRSSSEIDDQLLETERSMKAKLAEIVPPAKKSWRHCELKTIRLELTFATCFT